MGTLYPKRYEQNRYTFVNLEQRKNDARTALVIEISGSVKKDITEIILLFQILSSVYVDLY